MKLFSRHKRTPFIPDGVQVFNTEPTTTQPRKRNRWVLVGVVLFTLAVIVGAGLLLGRLWSTRDDNYNATEQTNSQDRVNQSPQENPAPETPEAVPAVDGGLNENNPVSQ